MICRNCKQEIESDNKFCPNCGVKNENEVEANSTLSDLSNEKMVETHLSSYESNTAKKKSKAMSPLSIYLISFSITIGIGVIIFAVLIFTGVLDIGSNNKKDIVNNINENSVADVISNKDNTVETEQDNPVYNYKYSYTELPDVVSLDSDERFTYSTVYNESIVAVYSFLFNEKNKTYSDFLLACEQYSILLQEENGFVYEKKYSEEKYEETGVLANYLTRDDFAISITPGIEDSLYYAYISLFPLTEETIDDDKKLEFDMPNYNKFLAGREIKSFTYDETVSMENGLFFIIYDVVARYPGDGTMTVDITLDLSSWYSDFYSNNGDFMILPFDDKGNVLSDAIPINYITNSEGYNVPMPFLVSSSTYENYTFTYAVPIDTASFKIYASNVLIDGSSPVYVMDIGF